MSATTVQIVVAILGIVGSAGAAFLGSWFGLRRFRSEKWWEKKVETYTAIFNALNDLSEEIDQFWNAEVGGYKLSEQQIKSLISAAAAALPEIKKQARIGSFVLSAEAERTLADLIKKFEQSHETYFDHIDSRGAALNEALKALKAAARADLKT